MKKVLLGSSSPRRKEILGSIINEFEIIKPDIDESIKANEAPVDYAERISEEKSISIQKSGRIINDSIIISSDTIVTIGNSILGKPDDFQHAKEMLNLLQGKPHSVITALTLHMTNNAGQTKKILTQHEKTSVMFKTLKNHDIENYLGLIQYMDKAGSYAIQDHGELIIQDVSGSISNVIGFPLRLFFRMIILAGLEDLLF